MAYDREIPSHSPAPVRSIVALVLMVVVAIVFLMFSGKMFENVDATEIMVVQSPMSGKLSWYTTQGIKWQGLGKVTSYQKRTSYEFETQVRFNDGGHGTMKGSVQWEMPLSDQLLTVLHQQYGSPEAIQAQLIEKVVNKSVYMTGPLMSSKESYAEKRNYLINYVEDQISNGVYRTVQHEVRIVDPITQQEKSAIVVDIQMTNNVPQRQEESALTHYGIKTSNFAINSLVYDETVEKQIQQQQQIAMDVQTAIAESRKAEQRKLTNEQQGMADAAKAKWDQEIVKAKVVTEGEQKLAVARLDNETAEQYRQATLKRADADAGYRKQVMAADGALQQRLDAYKYVAQVNADAIKNYKGNWVPGVQMAGSGTSGTGLSLLEIMAAKAAKELGVDVAAGR